MSKPSYFLCKLAFKYFAFSVFDYFIISDIAIKNYKSKGNPYKKLNCGKNLERSHSAVNSCSSICQDTPLFTDLFKIPL